MATDTIFGDALDLPIAQLIFQNADELVASRTRMLTKFTQAGLPSSLVEKGTDALNWTKHAHSACNSFLSLAKDIAEIPRDNLSLFMEASVLVENNEANAVIDPKTKESFKSAREAFLIALVTALESDTGNKVLDDLVEECSVGAAPVMVLAIRVQATLLAATQKQLATTTSLLISLATLGLIWRGIFYAVVIRRAGGSLENDLATQKVAEIITDASSKVLTVLPFAGELFDAFKTLIKLYNAIRDKEGQIDDLLLQLKSAENYLDSYQGALTLWSARAAPILVASGDLLRQRYATKSEVGKHAPI
jgi:hypothetical protein